MGALVQTTKSRLIETGSGFWGRFVWTRNKMSWYYDKRKISLCLMSPQLWEGSWAVPDQRVDRERQGGWEGVRRVKIPTRKQKMRLKETFWPWGLLSAGEGLKAKVSLLILFSISRVHFNNPFVYGTMTLASPILSRFSTLEGEMG